MFSAGSVCAQEQPRNNEFAVWYGDQFAPAYAFSEETHGRLYKVETGYTRMLLRRRFFACATLPWWFR